MSEAIESVLWNESVQMWFDFDILNSKQRNYFYTSNLFPLWAECYDVTKRDQVSFFSMKILTKQDFEESNYKIVTFNLTAATLKL